MKEGWLKYVDGRVTDVAGRPVAPSPPHQNSGYREEVSNQDYADEGEQTLPDQSPVAHSHAPGSAPEHQAQRMRWDGPSITPQVPAANPGAHPSMPL